MENLTNEQIIEIIDFYNLCGITEDMYLSSSGVLDLFTLLGIRPEYDKNGERLPTVYEQLSIAPKFVDGKEVPIVFAIKHKASKISKNQTLKDVKFTYSEKKDKKKDDKTILNKLKQDYLEAVLNGNMIEASRLYDMIDMLTGGKADYFIGVQFNSVKFYKKMQKQLLIDMFANFVILMILNTKQNGKQGIFRFDKLYKAFVEKQLNKTGVSVKSAAPVLSSISVSVTDDLDIKKIDIKTSAKKTQTKALPETKKDNENIPQDSKSFVSLVRSKVTSKLNKIKDSLIKKTKDENNLNVTSGFNKSEKMFNILEND